MSRAAILLLFVVAIAYTSAHPPQSEDSDKCGPNEVFNKCGSPCQDTCDKPASRICSLECKIGCECKPGYVKNKENRCVLTRDC
ncbi:chymotrypsin inhibitor-like [Osmia bicornis bicornis]|uniref:chymotrypsin inhibitor-like n=1 Tax=Osmia bicornis bicornis TaxID=1437191 RepID=UPI001EAEAF65|nr:chymotrypsin inhibitor-like [Osmia bicornis bicornis]